MQHVFVKAVVLGGAASLFGFVAGCGSATPADPYADMRMLSPEELGTANRNIDPVEQEERAHNAQFGVGEKSR